VKTAEAPARGMSRAVLGAIFFLSGAAAIVYQIVWQRALFTHFGSNMESVTLVVTAFMLGLGAGSAAGGALSRMRESRLPLAFALLEALIGGFGLISLPLFRWAAALTSGAQGLEVGLVAGALLLAPTLLMGATLPILVAYEVRRSGDVGTSVGTLYSLNTLGSAVGALGAAALLLGALGQAGSVRAAAAVNGVVALAVLSGLGRRRTS
jgi:spermidine synthase